MNTKTLLAGAGVGAALTFLLDPDRGRRRRALVGDKLARARRVTSEGLGATARDMTHRARGIAAETRRWTWQDDVDNETLAARIRSKLGRVCSHTRALAVSVSDDEITLRGPILAHEVPSVMATVEALAGTRRVNSQLQPHQTAEGVSALQGGGRLPAVMNLTPNRWSPSAKVLMAGGALLTGAYLASNARR